MTTKSYFSIAIFLFALFSEMKHAQQGGSWLSISKKMASSVMMYNVCIAFTCTFLIQQNMTGINGQLIMMITLSILCSSTHDQKKWQRNFATSTAAKKQILEGNSKLKLVYIIPVVNFINILQAVFALIFFWKKLQSQIVTWEKLWQNTFIWKSHE